MDNTQYTSMVDALSEVMNIGAQNAATALSSLTKHAVDVRTLTLQCIPVEEVTELVGQANDVTSVVLLELQGDIPGIALFLFPEDDAKKLTTLLSDAMGIKDTTDIEQSALCEIGNILAGACMAALADFLDIRSFQSVPYRAEDMLGSVLDGVLAELGSSSDQVLASRVSMTIENPKIQSTALFLFNEESTDLLLDTILRK